MNDYEEMKKAHRGAFQEMIDWSEKHIQNQLGFDAFLDAKSNFASITGESPDTMTLLKIQAFSHDHPITGIASRCFLCEWAGSIATSPLKMCDFCPALLSSTCRQVLSLYSCIITATKYYKFIEYLEQARDVEFKEL